MSEPGVEELSMEAGHQVIYINENALILDGDDSVQYVLGEGGDMQLVRQDGTHYLLEQQNLEQLQDKGHIVIQQAGYAEIENNPQDQVLEAEEQQMFSIGEDEELGEVTQVVLSEEQCRMLQGCGRVLLQEGSRRFVLDGDGLRELDPIVDEAELQSLEYILPDDNNESVTLVPYNGCKLMTEEFEGEPEVPEETTSPEDQQKDNMETDLEDIIEHCSVQMDADEQDPADESNQIVYVQSDGTMDALDTPIEEEKSEEAVQKTTADDAQHQEDDALKQQKVDENDTNNFESADDCDNTIASVKLQKIKCQKIYKKIVLMPDFATNDYPRISAPTTVKKCTSTNFQTDCSPKKTRNIQKPKESKINKKIFIGKTQDGKSLYGRIVAITPSKASKKLSRTPLAHDSESNDSNAADNPAEVAVAPVSLAGDGEKSRKSTEKIVKIVENPTTNAKSIVKTKNIFVKTEKIATIETNDASNIAADKLALDVRESQVVSVKRPISEVKSKKLLESEVTSAKVAKTLKKSDVGGSASISSDNKPEIIQVFKKEKSDNITSDIVILPTIKPKAELVPLILNSTLTADGNSKSTLDNSVNLIHNPAKNKGSKQDSNKVSYRLDLEGEVENEEITLEQGELLSLTNILSTLMKMPNLTIPLSTRDLMVVKEEGNQERIFIGRMLNLDEAGPADWNFMFMPELCKDYMGETCDKEVLLKTGNFLVVKLGKSSGGNACEVVIMDRAKAADPNNSDKLWEPAHISNSASKSRNFRKSCHVCKKVFYRMSNLSRHLTIHAVQEGADGEGNGGYSCSFCRCAFRFPSTLTRHILECHTDTNTANVRKYSLL